MSDRPQGRETMPATELLAELPENAAGIVITDPPWDLKGGGRFDACASYDRLDVEQIVDTLAEARRVLKPGAHLYLFAPASNDFFPIAETFSEDSWRPIRLLAWDKDTRRGLGAYRNAFEPVIVLANGPSRGYLGPPAKYPSLLQAKVGKGRTAKPWELYRIFLKMSAKPGELALDPYCGTNPLEKAVRRLEREQPWVAGDVLPPEDVALEVRERGWREAASDSERGHTDRDVAAHQQQTRLRIDE